MPGIEYAVRPDRTERRFVEFLEVAIANPQSRCFVSRRGRLVPVTPPRQLPSGLDSAADVRMHLLNEQARRLGWSPKDEK